MKGLLIKDWYITLKNFRFLLVFSAVFMIIGATVGANAVFPFYPIIVCGTLPISLFSFDEKSRWNAYCTGLPISRRQIVSAKYIELLIAEAGVIALTLLAQGIRMAILDTGSTAMLAGAAALWLASGLFSPAIMLPIAFRYGSDKGRIAYFIIIFGLVAGLMALGGNIPDVTGMGTLMSPVAALVTLSAALALTAASWWASVKLYEGKEGV